MEELAKVIEGVEGWCTLHKAWKLHELAMDSQCNLAVEIGIYGGKSLLPVAAAFAKKGAGRIFGVEPWENAVAIETATSAENDEWWARHDLIAIKRGFLKRVVELELEAYVRLLEIPSDAAIMVFQSARFNGKVDLIHIDGAHSLEESVFDCAYWLRILRSGGHIVLDDINWATVGIAFEFLKSAAIMTYSIDNAEEGHFAVFQKR
jgi:predicted O-methyltransferase YrrM